MKGNGDTPPIPDIAPVQAERVMSEEELAAVSRESDDELAEDRLRTSNEGFRQLVDWGADFVIRRVPGDGKTRLFVIFGLSVVGVEVIRRFKQRRARLKRDEKD